MRIFDFFTSLPTPERVALEIRSWGNEPGYVSMFGSRWSTLLNLSTDTLAWVARLGTDHYLERATPRLAAELPSTSDFIQMMLSAGIEKAIIHRPLPVDVATTDEATALLVDEFPDVLIGFARVDLADGPIEAARQLENSVTSLGLRGATLTPFWHGVPCDDELLDPVLTMAERLGVPIWIHTSMQWRRSVPLDIEHPRHIDTIAGRHPELKIVCGHGGWPWVLETVATAWRHPNVYVDVSAFRPRNVFRPGAGWESLQHYGANMLSDSIVFGSTWSLLGLTPQQATDEARNVPWPDDVKRRWLYDNAATMLDMKEA